MKRNKILLIDDDLHYLETYAKILTKSGFEVDTAGHAKQAIEKFSSGEPDVVVTDMYMPDMNGLELITHFIACSPNALILVITGVGSIQNAVEAVKAGAQAYLQKPFDINELENELRRLCDLASSRMQNDFLMSALKSSYDPIIGHSPSILALKERISIIGPTNSSVLILGESGTGKELIVTAIHESSERSKYPMVKVNCAALSSSLLESELFGHEKGAFTGAHQAKKGLIEIANGSTLFLDEIGEMSLEMQAKLLRVLQEKVFTRVGGLTNIKSDFRLVCATHQSLEHLVERRAFREDLYYRLNVIPITVPSLRERREDILLIFNYYNENFSKEMKRAPLVLTPEQTLWFTTYNWPGNIRELKNITERLCVFSKNGRVSVADFPNSLVNECFANTFNPSENLSEAMRCFEKKWLQKALDFHGWRIAETAIALGLARKNLYLKLHKHNLNRPTFSGEFITEQLV